MTEQKITKPNPGDQKIIKILQDLLGKKLEQVPEIKWNTRGYTVNQAGAVVGLGLYGFGIDDKKLKELAETLISLTSLTTLSLSSNHLTDISVLKELPNLMWLYLRGNDLTDISVLKELPNLTQLYLRGNELTNISVLKELPNLTRLDLRDNKLTDISVLNELPNLTQLYLRGNHLTDISVLKELPNLTRLDLRFNQLTDISVLKELPNLTQLYLRGNELTDISVLKKLPNLTQLYLSSNQLTDISVLKELPNLTQLDLSRNQLTDISVLKELPNLTQLYLSGNQLTDISVLKELPNLMWLDLRDNQLKNIPPEFFNRDWEIHWKGGYTLDGLNLFGNPLETPPVEIVKQGREAVRNYFKSLKGLRPEEVIRLSEAKLLVVGPGDVGKTFLSNRLIYGEAPPTESTEGIDIHKWMVDTKGIEGFRINLWDFGGQEIYHATHQFFLTKRSLYLFVWAARRDEDRVSFGYWLNVLKLLSDNAPVIMVMNKCDERKKAIDQAAIQKQFPNVIGFYEVSAEQDVGIEELRRRVIEEIEKLEQIGTTLPKQWVDIREQLEGMKEDGANYITYQQYQDICTDDNHKLNKKQAGHLAGYYHELGVILHFADNPVLKDIVFLNPEWATDAVYAVTDHKPIQNHYGRFHFNELKAIWKDYPEDKYAALLELMMKFELCFNLEGTKEYIIPELLQPERCSFEWSYQDNLHFQYKYDFMPAGIITRFMVRKHDLIKDDLCWKNGVVVEWEETGALIECNEFNDKIDIWIRGEDKKGMLGIIRCDIEHIHETLNRPVAAERMPCICSECKSSTEPHFYNYHDLRTLLRKNVRSTRCMKSAEEISIDVLLGTYGISEEERERGLGDRERSDRGGGNTHNYFYCDHVEGSKSEVVKNSVTNIKRYNQMTQEKVINIGNGNTINAPVVVADQIKNSFNIIAESDIKVELKELLHKLINEVNDAAKAVSEETAESMARDVESLSKEVVSSKPRRKWYEMSIEGLKEAAQAVGEVGKPILKTVSTLLPMLNGIFG